MAWNIWVFIVILILVTIVRFFIWKVIRKIKKEANLQKEQIMKQSVDSSKDVIDFDESSFERNLEGGKYHRLEVTLSAVFWVLLVVGVYILLVY